MENIKPMTETFIDWAGKSQDFTVTYLYAGDRMLKILMPSDLCELQCDDAKAEGR
jgi:hypothetical protein